MKDENYLKFPSILRDKLMSGEVKFSPCTRFQYAPIVAYRGIVRSCDDYAPVTREDFRSYAELGIKRRGVDPKSIEYYSASLYLSEIGVANALKFPRYNRKIAKGMVNCQIGPMELNEETEHVHWWLYDDVIIDDFKICDDFLECSSDEEKGNRS